MLQSEWHVSVYLKRSTCKKQAAVVRWTYVHMVEWVEIESRNRIRCTVQNSTLSYFCPPLYSLNVFVSFRSMYEWVNVGLRCDLILGTVLDFFI